MELSTLNPLQQGILFTLLILGHAFPVFGIISLFRAWTFRSALEDDSNKAMWQHTVSRMPTLKIEEIQMTGCKGGALSTNIISKSKITTAARGIQTDTSSLREPEGSWNNYGFVVVTDSRHLDQSQLVTPVPTIDDKKDIGNWKAHISCLTSWSKGMTQRAANHLSYGASINCNQPGGIEYMALSLIGAFLVIYFISFLILGIVSIGFWSKFVRPDIPRGDGASPFWAGAFLATSAFCNNGMSLIDTNMGPYQEEYAIGSIRKTICQCILLTQPTGPFHYLFAAFLYLLETRSSPASCGSSYGF